MPWSVKKLDGKFCVVKEGETSPIKGGCHDSRAEATDHLRALYSAEAEMAVSKSYDEDEVIEREEEDFEDLSGGYFVFADTMKEYAWEGPIVFENVYTGDNRIFRDNSINWQEDTLPWAFRWQKASGQGHAGSVPVGRVDRIERKEDGSIWGYGVIIPELSNEADEYYKLIKSGAGGGVSVDGDSAQFEIQEQEKGSPKVEFSSMRLRALSAVDIPAFNGARIHLVDQPTEDHVEMSEEISVETDGEFAYKKMNSFEEKVMDSDEEPDLEDEAEDSEEDEDLDEDNETVVKDDEDQSDNISFAAVTKTEDGVGFPASAYAYVPDPDSPSTWKLRLWATPDGGPDAGIVGAAIAALGKGFRGNKVQIPVADLPEVKAKVRAAWMEANSDKSKDEMPETIKMSAEEVELNLLREELARKKKKRKRKSASYGWQIDETLTAAAIPTIPSTDFFIDPDFEGPTALTVTPDGKVFGHLALFNTCHIGFPGTCVKPPKGSKYQYFHTGQIETAEGDLVEVGHLTFKTGHADMSLGPKIAAEHYDNTGAVAADVRAGEDQFGIWVTGALRPGLSDEDIRAFRAAPLSGDWRRIAGKLELVGALSVNVPGFPVPRVRAMVAGGETETLFTFLQDDDEEFDSELIARIDKKIELASKIQDFFKDDIDNNPPEGTISEEVPSAPSKAEIQRRAESYTKNQFFADLKAVRELLDDPDATMPKRVRSALEELYDGFVKVDNGKRTTYSGLDLDVIDASGLEIEEWEEQLELSGLNIEEFYNQCHDENGRFCEGPDGPGRTRDNVQGRHYVEGRPHGRDDPEHQRGGSGGGGGSQRTSTPSPNNQPSNQGVRVDTRVYENYRTTRRRATGWAAAATIAAAALNSPISPFLAGLAKAGGLAILANPAVLSLTIATGVAYAARNVAAARRHRSDYNRQVDRKIRFDRLNERQRRERERLTVTSG